MSLHHNDINIATERQGQFKNTVAMNPPPPPPKKKQQKKNIYDI